MFYFMEQKYSFQKQLDQAQNIILSKPFRLRDFAKNYFIEGVGGGGSDMITDICLSKLYSSLM